MSLINPPFLKISFVPVGIKQVTTTWTTKLGLIAYCKAMKFKLINRIVQPAIGNRFANTQLSGNA